MKADTNMGQRVARVREKVLEKNIKWGGAKKRNETSWSLTSLCSVTAQSEVGMEMHWGDC